MDIPATIVTSKGEIHVNLFADAAPVTVANFVNLAQRKFYDGLNFHRVIPHFMIQGGCPLGSGTGGPGYQFEDEFSPKHRHDKAGMLSMANAGPKTNGSQFFITHTPTPHLNDAHTVFGEVLSVADQQVVDSIKQGDKLVSVAIEGDAAELLASMEDRVNEWNKIIDSKFPALAR